jgi:hypothetical protein
MLSIKSGTLICFEEDNWGHLDKPAASIRRTIPPMGGTKTLPVLAHPKVAVGWNEELEFVLYKIVAGRSQFVYSEKTKARTSASSPDIVELNLGLQHAPWGSGAYRIDLLKDRVVVASGKIVIT